MLSELLLKLERLINNQSHLNIKLIAKNGIIYAYDGFKITKALHVSTLDLVSENYAVHAIKQSVLGG